MRATPGARIEELAHHWLAATRAADVGKAIGYARQAGERALANLAFEEAAAHFARALGVLEPRDPDGERLRCDLLLALGDAQRRGGDARYRETVANAAAVARALGDGERLALAALASAKPGGFMANANVVDEGLIALYEEATGALGDADSLLRARVLGQLAVELVYTPHRERRDALTREAVAIARRLGDRTGLAQVLILRLIAMNDPFTLAERLALTGELTALAGEVGSSELAWHAAVHRTGALLESGDIGGAERALAEVERLAGELRQPFYTWWARIGTDDARRDARRARCGGTNICDLRARHGWGPARGRDGLRRPAQRPPAQPGPRSASSPRCCEPTSTPCHTCPPGEPSSRGSTPRRISSSRRASRSTSCAPTASIRRSTGRGRRT